MTQSQPCILQPSAAAGRGLTYRCIHPEAVANTLRALRDAWSTKAGAIGIGEPCVRALGKTLPGLRTFPALSGPGCSTPSTQEALWIMLSHGDRGELFDRTRELDTLLAPAFLRVDTIDTFVYRGGRDLTGYEDGTENPKGDAAVQAALCTGALAGGSFVAVQRWVHDLHGFDAFAPEARDGVIGRSAKTNEELADAPISAHVKRSAQESYDPPAFMVRRSMPWTAADTHGLEFIAYGADLDRFERVLRRMLGLEDGTVDGLFSFSRPVTGGYYFCPPVRGDKLELSCLGL
ncbi:MAG TPA: Dyp-type peroxidase [Polyangiales bacterium]|jgi:putative iron-dependent peroxidase|nr:Dyp-type peroxidase [Polyangiales bacterium]